MITIEYPEQTKTINEWEATLKELVVSYQLKLSPDIKTPRLTEKDMVYSGEAAIRKFLSDLEQDIRDWRKPGCGI